MPTSAAIMSYIAFGLMFGIFMYFVSHRKLRDQGPMVPFVQTLRSTGVAAVVYGCLDHFKFFDLLST